MKNFHYGLNGLDNILCHNTSYNVETKYKNENTNCQTIIYLH